jgi:hypothetical protein
LVSIECLKNEFELFDDGARWFSEVLIFAEVLKDESDVAALFECAYHFVLRDGKGSLAKQCKEEPEDELHVSFIRL